MEISLVSVEGANAVVQETKEYLHEFIELKYFTKPYEIIEILRAELTSKKIMEHLYFSAEIAEDFATPQRRKRPPTIIY